MTLLTDATLLQGRQILNESATLDADQRSPMPLPKGASDPVVLIRTARLEWKRAALPRRDHRQPDLSQRDDVQGRRKHGVRKRQHRQRVCQAAPPSSPSQNPPPPAAAGTEAPAKTPKPAAADDAATTRREPAGPKPRGQRELPADGRCHPDRVVRRRQENRPIDLEVSGDGPHRLARRRFRSSIRGGSSSPAESPTASRGPRPCCCWRKPRRATIKTTAQPPSYEEAAKAVATVQQDGLRGVLAGFVVDSLIASGRFQDARKCIVLYPDPVAAARRPGRNRRVSGQAGQRPMQPATGSPPRSPKNSAPLSTAASQPAS